MSKLIANYLADKSEKNRLAVVKRAIKHPMSLCYLNADEMHVVIMCGGK